MNERWKLILEPNYKGEMEVFLYNLRDDPECKNNVIKNYPEIARKLLNKLTEYYSDEIYFVLKGSYLQELSL
jgi:hypothetical protein